MLSLGFLFFPNWLACIQPEESGYVSQYCMDQTPYTLSMEFVYAIHRLDEYGVE